LSHTRILARVTTTWPLGRIWQGRVDSIKRNITKTACTY